MIPAWCVHYVGLPFKDKGRGPAFDCWGLVRHILVREQGLELPDYSACYAGAGDSRSVASAVRIGLRDWSPVQQPEAFDLVILKLAGRPWHCGLVAGDDWMIHALEGTGTVMERLTSPLWRNRIEGFYRHG